MNIAIDRKKIFFYYVFMLDISGLPDELLAHIFSFCEIRVHGKLAQVCRDWNRLIWDPMSRQRPARRSYGIRKVGFSHIPLHPSCVEWYPSLGPDGQCLPPLPLLYEGDYEIKPAVYRGQAVLAGRSLAKKGLAVVDAEGFEELAFLEDQGERFTLCGWFGAESGSARLLLSDEANRPYEWDPQSGLVLSLPDIPRCVRIERPVVWNGELSILYLDYTSEIQNLCVRPLRGGPSTTLESPSPNRLLIQSPYQEWIVTWSYRSGVHSINCWNVQKGVLHTTIPIEGRVTDMVVVGRGRQARLAVMARRRCEVPEDTMWEDLLVVSFLDDPLVLYSLETGEFESTLLEAFPRDGGLLVTTEGEVSYLHAFGNADHFEYHRPIIPEVCSWQFVEGRARLFETGLIELGHLALEPPDPWVSLIRRFGFEPSYALDCLLLPGDAGQLMAFAPTLVRLSSDGEPSSSSSDKERSRSASISSQRSLDEEPPLPSVARKSRSPLSLLAILVTLAALAALRQRWRAVIR